MAQDDPRRVLLIVDDNPVDRELVRRLLGASYELREASTAQEGLAELRRRAPDCVLLDDRLPDGRGVDLLSDFISLGVATLLLTGQGNEEVAAQALRAGASGYVVKGSVRSDEFRRIVDEALARQQLQRSLAVYKNLFDTMPSAVFVFDITHDSGSPRLVDVNPAGVEMDLPGQLVEQHATAALSSLEQHGSGRDSVLELPRIRIRSDEVYEVKAARLSHALLGIYVEDVSSRVAAERARDVAQQQMRAAQRLDSIGRLAGGVAHDFNNLLTVIEAHTELLEELLDDPEERDALLAIQEASRKAASLTRQLLTFSREQPHRPKHLRLDEVVMGMQRVLPRLLGEDIKLELELDDRDAWILADQSQLEQVLLNLVVNARDSMERGGNLRIETRVEGAGADTLGCVVLTVRDNGEGMDAATQERCMEPFFTTKPEGHGTGLGLSTVYGVVRRCGGTIGLESELGRGTTFHVRLPISPPADVVAESECTDSARGTETLLLVEDDDAARRSCSLQLRRLGYRVIEAEDAPSALNAVLTSPEIALVVSDVIMPDVSGPELVTLLEDVRPGIRALFVSGYTGSRLLREQNDIIERHGIVRKPLQIQSLGRAVRKRLERDEPTEVEFLDPLRPRCAG